MEKEHLDKSDGGFTLIEVLIAMLILAIIVVPLLHTFVSSARMNRKAKEQLRLTTAAQDIMEGLKASTIEELVYQFNYPDASHAANPLIDINNEFHVIDRSLIAGTIKEIRLDGSTFKPVVRGEETTNRANVTASIYSEDYGVNYEFLGRTDGIYYFEMRDVSVQTGGNTRYDALIRLDASPYRGDKTIESNHNSKDVVSIREMNNLYDAFYVFKENDVYNAALNINASYPLLPREVDETDLQRTITIDVDQETMSGKSVVRAYIHIKYVAAGMAADGSDIEYEPLGSEGKQIFNNISSEAELRNVYLFYFPIYNDKTEKIEFNNPDAIPVTLHVAKQEPSTVTSLLNSQERNYKCELWVNDTGAASVTALRTNLSRNLYDAYLPETVTKVKLPFVKYYLNGASKDLETEAQNLSGTEERDRLFDITISLYEAGAAANGYPADQRLTALEGSKNN